MGIKKEKAIMWQKKLLLWTGVSVFAAMMGLTTAASAQVNLPVQAEVLDALVVTPGADLNFGAFVPDIGGDIVVNPDGVTATTTTGPVLFGTDARGTVTVTGTGTSAVQVMVTVVTPPTEAGGTTMTLSNLTCGSDDTVASYGAVPCSFNMPAGGPGTSTNVGIGGTLTVAPAQTVGTYTGVVAVTAAYN